MYEYNCKVVRVVDGDTVDVDIDLGFGLVYAKQRIRLYGIDTPESRTRNRTEKKFGLYAKEFLTEELRKGEESGTLILKTRIDGKGKFGRILGTFVRLEEDYMWVDINDLMIGERIGVAYHGQSKKDIQEEHKLNFEYLIENGIVE